MAESMWLALFIRGEGGHPAWYSAIDLLTMKEPIGKGVVMNGAEPSEEVLNHPWTAMRTVLTLCRVWDRTGIKYDAAVIPDLDSVCSCRACRFLTLAASQVFCANRRPDEDWRPNQENPATPWWLAPREESEGEDGNDPE